MSAKAATKKTSPKKKGTKKEAAKPAAAPKNGKGPKAKAEGSPARKKATKPQVPATVDTPQGDDSSALVVFAFRLLRSERDEIHAAVGSGKASRFVKAVALAAARHDPKALQEAIKNAKAEKTS